MEWTRAEAIAWAAGLFDGEGTTSASDRWDTPHVRVPQAGDSEPEVLRRLLEILHVGTISGPEMRLPHQPSWRFAVGEVNPRLHRSEIYATILRGIHPACQALFLREGRT